MLDVMLESMRAFQRGFGRSARGGEVIELDGVVACLTPGLGTHSLFNAAVYERPEALVAALPALGRRYAAAGVRKWGAWAHETDTAAARVLAENGMVLDSEPVAMARSLAEGDFEADAGIERTDDLEVFDRVEALAWSFPVGTFTATMPGAPREFNCWLARDDSGEPAAIVGTRPPPRRLRGDARRDGARGAWPRARRPRDAPRAGRGGERRVHHHDAAGHRGGTRRLPPARLRGVRPDAAVGGSVAAQVLRYLPALPDGQRWA